MRFGALLSLAVLASSSGAQTMTGPLAPNLMPSTAAVSSINSWTTGIFWKQPQWSGTVGVSTGIPFYGVRNEHRSVQMHWQETGGGASYSCAFSSLTHIGSPAFVIYGSSWITTYVEQYIQYSTPSAKTTYYIPVPTNSVSVPDPLVPVVDPDWNQATNISPFTVAQSSFQSCLFSVIAPTAAPDGWYQGVITVTRAGIVVTTQPVSYGVIGGFIAPSTPTLHTNYNNDGAPICSQQYFTNGGGGGCGPYTNSGGSSTLGLQLTQLDATQWFLNHKMTSSVFSYGIDSSFTTFNSQYGNLLTGLGTGRTPLMFPGATPTSFRYQPSTYGTTSAQNWQTNFVNNSYNTVVTNPVDQTLDEGTDTSGFITRATLMHAANPPMRTNWTTSLDTTLGSNATNYLDTIVVNNFNMDQYPGYYEGNNRRSSYSVWLASQSYACGGGGVACPVHQLWSYDSCQATNCGNLVNPGSPSNYPSYQLDALPITNQAMEFETFVNTQAGELYYDWSYAWQNNVTGGGSNWLPYKNVYYSGGQGDGTIVYPLLANNGQLQSGNTAFFSVATDTPTIAPSLRLMLREEGIGNFEYMSYLTANGQASVVAKATSSFYTNGYTYNTSTFPANGFTGDLPDAIYAMQVAIQAIAYPAGVSTPTITSALTASGTVGTPFSYTITATQNPTSYSATNLPGWASVNTGTGVISGTPNAAATTNVVIGATNSAGTGTNTLVLTVTNFSCPNLSICFH
jgi:hypothetical protein